MSVKGEFRPQMEHWAYNGMLEILDSKWESDFDQDSA